MTSAELAKVYRRARMRWFHSALRSRVYDEPIYQGMGGSQEWCERFCARAVSLFAFWSRSSRVPEVGSRWQHPDPDHSDHTIFTVARTDGELTWFDEGGWELTKCLLSEYRRVPARPTQQPKGAP